MKNHAETKRHQSPEELIEHINELMSEAEAMLAGPAVGKVSDRLHAIYEQLGSAKEQLAECYGSAKQSVVDSAKATDNSIRSHPYESLAIALGAGVLLGFLIRRSR